MMDSRLGAIGGQAADEYQIYPDVDALQYMGRSPPGSIQEYPVRPDDSVSMTASHGRGGSNVLSRRPIVVLESLNEPPPMPASKPHRMLYNWRWESLEVIMASGALTITFVLVHNYKERPVSQWYHGITINTVLSILTTAITATISILLVKCLEQLKFSWFERKGQPLYDIVILDDAGRGWPGAIRLILSIHPVHMATAASLLLLLSVAVGPFVQQAVTTHCHNDSRTTTYSVAIEGARNASNTELRPHGNIETMLLIDWRWLVPPTVIVFLSVLVFVCTMIRTRHKYVRSCSALALISLGAQIEKRSRGTIRSVHFADFTLEDLAKSSKTVNVRYEEDRWHIVRNS